MAKKFDDKNYWKNRHARVNNLKASGLKSVSVKANHFIYRILTEQYAKLLANLDLEDVKTILDCGFGDGHFLKFFSENYPNKKLTGVDISPAAKEKIDVVPQKQLHISDLASLKLDKKFDLVHCFDVLYHILDEADYRTALQNLADHSDKYVILHEKFVHKARGSHRLTFASAAASTQTKYSTPRASISTPKSQPTSWASASLPIN